MTTFIELCKVFRFEASHQLPHYSGKCARLHGHSYKLEVEVRANLGDADPSGVVVDFDVLKACVTECVLEPYDHQHLNQFFVTPTAEHMVAHIFDTLQRWLDKNVKEKYVTVQRVRLWETKTCWAQRTRS